MWMLSAKTAAATNSHASVSRSQVDTTSHVSSVTSVLNFSALNVAIWMRISRAVRMVCSSPCVCVGFQPSGRRSSVSHSRSISNGTPQWPAFSRPNKPNAMAISPLAISECRPSSTGHSDSLSTRALAMSSAVRTWPSLDWSRSFLTNDKFGAIGAYSSRSFVSSCTSDASCSIRLWRATL